MKLTFRYGKINKQKNKVVKYNETSQEEITTGEWRFKGKEGMTTNRRRIPIMPG